MTHLIAIDQGTTSTRAIVFDAALAPVASASEELTQIYPAPGEVEHDGEAIWAAVVKTVRAAMRQADVTARDVAGIGITNQRETTVLWDRATGAAVHPAIVWQDRRTAPWCAAQRDAIGDAELGRRTGLLFDAYFSASKIAWILDHVAGARAAAEAGKLAFGTVDSFLLWRLTGGRVHATDATNASRTMLFNLETQDWDAELLKRFAIPRAILPEVRDCAAEYGATEKSLLGASVPIAGIAGDQHAAAFGQACFRPGSIKSTYGTGCFVLMNTGAKRVRSKNRMLTTLAYRLDGEPVFALEGSIFVSGAAVQWLRDGLKAIASAADTERLAASIPDTGGVYLVPAFTGLGAPWWDPDARGAIVGLTRGSGRAHLARAALEAIAYQTRDVVECIGKDSKLALETLRVDGGACENDFLMQFQADVLGAPVQRPALLEVTAKGAALLAGLGVGFWKDAGQLEAAAAGGRRFEPRMSVDRRDALYAGWKRAVERARNWVEA
jgi:glycerol kinase